MSEQPSSYLSSKLEGRLKADKSGNSIFAIAPIKKGELIAVFGGVVYEWEDFIHLPEREKMLCIQVEDRHFLVPRPISEGDYVNHSCNPNAGLSGQIGLVAMRDIKIGEEVCFDYAMSDTMAYDEFECLCGAPTCRGKVGGSDWQRPELQKRYAGFFAPHVQRKIDAMKAERRAFERAMRAAAKTHKFVTQPTASPYK
ncbi:MAG TPA: SET domain-containing protein-lysine N-methyltransferase [Anaerolineae bacterium]|nr:SET domain-containing protein-lysine N-methyltransferase [Anaerolineae bacterium]HCK65103.1 SET domain-containing protein-lysine N-methyltransferase [Anaerolineae bacterium]